MKSFGWSLATLALAAAFLLLSSAPEMTSARRLKNAIVTKLKSDFLKIDLKDATRFMVSFHNLIKYVKRLPSPDANKLIGFRQLKTELFTRSLQYTPQIIQLNAALLSAAKKLQDSSAKKGIAKLQKQIKPMVDIMVTKWGTSVSIGLSYIFGPALKLANRYPEDFKTVIVPVIQLGYNYTLMRVGYCLSFLKKVDNLELRSIGFFVLANLMSSNNHFDSVQAFHLAYDLSGMVNKTSLRIPKRAKMYVDETKKLLPRMVRDIVFNGKGCRVQNKHFGTYLYADDEVLDEDHRFEYLWWRSSERRSDDRWTFTTTVKDKGKIWTIENEKYKDFLMANDSSSSAHRRNTNLWRNESRIPAATQWVLSMADAGESLVVRSGLWNQEYMFADGKSVKDERRRKIYTWEGSDSDVRKAEAKDKAERCKAEKDKNPKYEGQECVAGKVKEVEKPTGTMWSESKWKVACG